MPSRVVTNAELSKTVDTSDEWIRTRTGIHERRMAEPGVFTSDLAAIAARKALAAAGRKPEELTHIIVASFSPDSMCPSTASRLQHLLGGKGGYAIDVNAACSGFVYGLEAAAGFIALKPESKVLLVASEILSLHCNWEDRSTCVLFGDGAGAVVVEGNGTPADGAACKAEIETVLCNSDGSLGELLTCLGGGSRQPYALGDVIGPEYFIRMQGREVFKHAVRSMCAVCNDILEQQGLTLDEIDLFIPHQANMRIIEAVGERLKFDMNKVFVNVQKYGNTSAASIPIALAEAFETGIIKPGMRVLLTTFGGGFTWAAALIKF